jgi:hypothetical protein
MDNVYICDSYINISSSQTYKQIIYSQTSFIVWLIHKNYILLFYIE